MDLAVALVDTYLRLNGYFTVTEFQVQHPVGGGRYETATDLDILAIRLPHAAATVLRHPSQAAEQRQEVFLADDPALLASADMPDLLIGEVKEGAAALNRRLATPEVLHAALRRAGCCAEEHIAGAASVLAARGEFIAQAEDARCRVRLASFCGYVEDVPSPAVLTVTLRHIVEFISSRLRAYRPVLRSAQFKDSPLAFLKLLDKMGITLTTPSPTTTGGAR
jgi:hypothetical protein